MKSTTQAAQIPLTGIKQTRGGVRIGAGRKPGTGKREASQVMRVPLGLVSEVERLISAYRQAETNEKP